MEGLRIVDCARSLESRGGDATIKRASRVRRGRGSTQKVLVRRTAPHGQARDGIPDSIAGLLGVTHVTFCDKCSVTPPYRLPVLRRGFQVQFPNLCRLPL